MTIVDESRGSVDERVDERVDDCISRQAAVNACLNGWNKDYKEIVADIKALSSVTPAEKVGRWIEKDGYDGDTYYDCSECGESWTTIEGTPWNNGMKYCPNCGARMEVDG